MSMCIGKGTKGVGEGPEVSIVFDESGLIVTGSNQKGVDGVSILVV